MGCAARYSTENLRSLAPAAELINVCVRFPTFGPEMLVVAHNSSAQTSVSDDDWDEFERAAEAADYIYRYDPNAPKDSASRLPWPYDRMSCDSVSSDNTPRLPNGFYEIPISQGMREALVASLTRKHIAQVLGKPLSLAVPFQKQWIAAPPVLVPVPEPYFEPIEPGQFDDAHAQEVSHMLRDAIRGRLPTVQRDSVYGPTDEQISIIDTKTGQIVGGFAAGATVSVVPLAAPVTDLMLATGKLPPPTREFAIGKSLGEMGVGLGQVIVGGGAAIGGGGASVTGAGAIAGVPVCVAGIALATNGAITFYNGATTLVVAVCHPERLPAAPEAAPAGAPNMPSVGGRVGQQGAPATNKPATNAAKDVKAGAAQAAKPANSTPKSGQTDAPEVSTAPAKTSAKSTAKTPAGEAKHVNKALAGKKHPVTGVPFDADGYPDFRAAGVVKAAVKIKMTGPHEKDVKAANDFFKWTETPEGCTWHHHQDGTTMQLVPKDIHQKTGHTGGAAYSRTKGK